MTNEELLEIARGGGPEANAAREKLIVDNKGIVYVILQRHSYAESELEDYYQIGIEGLIKGVNDLIENGLKGGFKVITYLSTCAENEILMQMRRCARLKRKAKTISIYEPIDEEGGLCLEDVLPSSDNVEKQALDNMLFAHIKNIVNCRLTPNQAKVIKTRYFSGAIKTMQETADEIGMTKQGVSKIELKAINIIKEILTEEDKY